MKNWINGTYSGGATISGAFDFSLYYTLSKIIQENPTNQYSTLNSSGRMAGLALKEANFKVSSGFKIIIQLSRKSSLDAVQGKKEDIEHIAKLIDYEKIVENDYNLSVSSYVEAKDTREKVEITELNEEIKATVEKIDKLRTDIDKIIEVIEG